MNRLGFFKVVAAVLPNALIIGGVVSHNEKQNEQIAKQAAPKSTPTPTR